MGFETDHFKSKPLLAVKLLGRYLTSARYELLGGSKKQAALFAEAEIFRRLPTFIDAWQAHNCMPWKGSNWFIGRIGHQSEDRNCKASQLGLREFIAQVAALDSVMAWCEWEELVYKYIQAARPVQYAYLLPFREHYPTADFTIQKVGITTSLLNRYREHACRGPSSESVPTVRLFPAPYFLCTCELGTISGQEAIRLEHEFKAAVGNGLPPKYGAEWFQTSTLRAIAAVTGVALSKKLKWSISQEAAIQLVGA